MQSRSVALFSGGLLMAVLMGTTETQAIVCSPTPNKLIVIHGATDITESTNWKDIYLSSASFRQTARGCILVRFSAMLDAPYDHAFFRVLLNGKTVASPREVKHRTGDGNTQMVSYEFIFLYIPAGARSVKMQWRSEAGDTIQVKNPMLVIQYL